MNDYLWTNPYQRARPRERYRAFIAEWHARSLPTVEARWADLDRYLYRKPS